MSLKYLYVLKYINYFIIYLYSPQQMSTPEKIRGPQVVELSENKKGYRFLRDIVHQ
jgi:hypothetical protein